MSKAFKHPGCILALVSQHVYMWHTVELSSLCRVEVREFPFQKAVLVTNAVWFQAASGNSECNIDRLLEITKKGSNLQHLCYQYSLHMNSPPLWSFQSYFYSWSRVLYLDVTGTTNIYQYSKLPHSRFQNESCCLITCLVGASSLSAP